MDKLKKSLRQAYRYLFWRNNMATIMWECRCCFEMKPFFKDTIYKNPSPKCGSCWL